MRKKIKWTQLKNTAKRKDGSIPKEIKLFPREQKHK
jgi:hypothetical protein